MNVSVAPQPLEGLLHRIARVVRRIIGAPDYDRYVLHVHAAHPGETPMTESEFTQAQLEGKYSRPGTRCC